MDRKFYRMERSYGGFARAIQLPAPVDGTKVNAWFKNGLLTVQLVKSTAGTGASIPIRTE